MTAPQLKSIAADYLAFERGSTERHQFVDGEIFAAVVFEPPQSEQ